MDWEKIEHLQKAIEPEWPLDVRMLVTSGLCTPNEEVNDLLVVCSPVNFVGELVDTLVSEDVETEPFLLYMKDSC